METADKVARVEFDQYVLLDAQSASTEDCPVRAEILLGDMLKSKGRPFTTTRTRHAHCGETYLATVGIERLGLKKLRYIRPGAKRGDGDGFGFTPTVWVAEGPDQHVHLTFSIEQGTKQLATTSVSFVADS